MRAERGSRCDEVAAGFAEAEQDSVGALDTRQPQGNLKSPEPIPQRRAHSTAPCVSDTGPRQESVAEEVSNQACWFDVQAAKQAMQRDPLHPEQPGKMPETREGNWCLAQEAISPRSQAANTSPNGFPSSVSSPRCFSTPMSDGTPRAASIDACQCAEVMSLLSGRK